MTRRALLLAAGPALAVSFSVAGGGEPAPTSWGDPAERAGVLTFSHRLHVVDEELECEDCHVDVEASRTSLDRLLPTHEQCETCHEVEEEDGCTMCHANDDPDEFPMPERHIFFGHDTHVAEQELECARCHAGIEERESTESILLPAMETCSACHDDVSAPADCGVCHDDPANLRPLSHRLADWRREHAREMRTGGAGGDCASCHLEEDCQACHDAPFLAAAGPDAPRTLPEWRVAPDGTKALVLERVHGLDYLSLHPFEARTRELDCDSCHDPQDFCVACHEGTQDGGFPSPFPPGHGAEDFVRVGVGSGGGRHAELARRDIESCAACHDEAGADPVCIRCHEDRTPGLGNDPRTHASDFTDYHGEWHGDPGAVCFQCHTDTGVAGLGFCGYCHGEEER